MKNQPSIKKRKRRSLIHISGDTCCINCIFEKDVNGNYTKDALLYQNILEYFNIREEKLKYRAESFYKDGKRFERRIDTVRLRVEPESFATWNLTKWLLRKNLEFVKYYSGLSRYMTMSPKIANRLGMVQQFVDDLENSLLLTRTGIQVTSKNRMPTMTYEINNFGMIILLLMKYIIKDTTEETKIRIRQTILQLVQRYVLKYNSHICDFIARLYSKAIEMDHSESMVNTFVIIVHENTHTTRTLVDVFNRALQIHLMDERTRNYFMDIWMKALNEFPEDIQRIVICHEKAEIESRIHLAQPPKDWEEAWIVNIQNYSQLTLYGKCSQCSKKYPVIVDYYEYRKELLPDRTIKRNCLKCNAENSLIIGSEIKE